MSQVKGKKGKKSGKNDPYQEAINKFLKVSKGEQKASRFSPFDTDQLDQSYELCATLMEIANKNPDDPIGKVLEYATEQTKTTDPELVRWSLMNFITHHPAARNRELRIPSLVKRNPDVAIPKKKKKKIPVTPGPIVGSDQPVEESDDIELYMNWFREDPNINEHHEHWHVVYQGVPDPNNTGTRIVKDRHGELFVYMHRQMLARYDIERAAMNLPLIEPLDDYRAPIPQAYQPNQHLIDGEDNTPFGDRKANMVFSDFRNTKIDDMEEFRRRVEEAIDNNQFMDGGEITINLLGGILEPAQDIPREYREYYNGLHGKGHMAIASLSLSEEEEVDLGVMSQTRTAARDPAFYRWHRHIDDLANKWEEKQPPNDFSESPPPVNIREGDIILAFKDQLPINHGETQDTEAEEFGEQQFGGENFDTDVSSNEYVTDTLETKMKVRTWDHIEDSGITEDIEHLFPREFYYYFRVENTSSSPLNATFRVFLAPEELADSRRHWIELDKFKSSLAPNSKTVVSRDCDMSAVIRQPPQKTDEEMDETSYPAEEGASRFCDCGWPFHLLLPRGRRGGMKFKLLVFITDWAEDEVPRLSRCGSISYCGAEGPGEKYPDSKPMGYPFDKPFKNNSYEETFAGLNNATIRDVTINWVDDFPEIVVET